MVPGRPLCTFERVLKERSLIGWTVRRGDIRGCKLDTDVSLEEV